MNGPGNAAVERRPSLPAPPHSCRRANLFIDVRHGLCNRLRAMASAAVVAERTDRRLVVVWCPDHHCEAPIGDLLCYSGPVIEDEDVAALFRARAGAIYNYMEIEPGARFQAPILPPGDDAAGRDVYIRSAYTLTGPYCDPGRDQTFLRRLQPAPQVLDLVARVPGRAQVAAHIRMATGEGFDHLSYESPANWPAERHRELSEWRRKSHVSRFTARLDTLVSEDRADTIFAATDLPETYAMLTERYGARLSVLERDRFDRSRRQLVFALADLILLSAAPHFLASTWSAFSDLARRLGSPGRIVEQSGRDF